MKKTPMMQLKQAIQESGLSVEKLAQQLGITKNAIYLWLRGERYPQLTPRQLQKLTMLLSLSLPEVLDMLVQLEDYVVSHKKT